MHNSLSFDKKFQQNTSSFPRILWALVHFVKPGERRRRIQCQPIVLHGRQKIKNFWAKYKVETTKGIFSNASSHLFQDPLYHALVALGLGHKIQINVMASLEMKEVKAAFMDSFYSACKGQPSKGWDKYHHLMNIISEQHYHHRCIVIHEAFQLLASGIKDRDKMRKMSKHC